MRRGAGPNGIGPQPRTLGLDARNLPLEGRSKPASASFGRGAVPPLAARRCEDRVTDRVEVVHHLIRPEPHERVSLRLEPFRAGCIGTSTEGVLFTVDLDDQLRRRAEEVDDVAPDRLLAAEREPTQAAIAQLTPKTELGVGHLPTHGFRQCSDARRQSPARQSPLPKFGSRCSPTFDLPSRGRLRASRPIPHPQSLIPT